MPNLQNLALSVALTASLLLAACAPAPATTASPIVTLHPTAIQAANASPVEPTTVPASAAISATVQSDDSSIKVGVVVDARGAKNQAFNQLAWQGLQKAAADFRFQEKYVDSPQPTNYESSIDALATDGYDVIITVGASMGNVTAMKARQYPNIHFAIVDYAYAPTQGAQACADTVKDCYVDGGLTNVTSLIFAEDQSAFLAGVLAGGMSRSGFVCSISSLKTPDSDRAVINFRAGAVWQAGEAIRGMNNYINIQTMDSNVPTVTDATEGKETALKLIGGGCDVVFGVAADGALLAAQERSVMAIGTNVDEYDTVPAAKEALLTSALKRVDVAVYDYLRTVADGSVKAGISIGTLQNGGVDLAPFHEWDSKISADLKAQIQKASDGIKDGSIALASL